MFSQRFYFILGILLIVFVCRSLPRDWGNIGDSDMDQNIGYTQAARETILTYGQFPHWNPYHCGGNVLNAHSHSRNISPFFLLSLFLPAHDALKIEIFLLYVIQFSGVWFLLRWLVLQRGQVPSGLVLLVCSLVGSINSNMTLRNHDGFITQQAVAFFPWIALCVLHGVFTAKSWFKWAWVAGILYGWILTGGGINVFPDSGLVLGLGLLLWGLFQRSFPWGRVMASLVTMVASAVATTSIKLIPLLNFTLDFPRLYPTDSHLPWSALWGTFFNQKQDIRYQLFSGQTFAYTEYGAYIGWPLVVLLIGWGVSRYKHGPSLPRLSWRQWSPAVMLLGIVMWLALGGSGWGPWEVLHALPPYSSFHIPSRFLIYVVLALVVLVGVVVNQGYKNTGRHWLLVLLMVVAVGEFVRTTSKPVEKSFRNPVAAMEKELDQQADYFRPGEPFDQIITSFQYGFAHDPYYPFITRNLSRLNCFENTRPAIGAKPTRATPESMAKNVLVQPLLTNQETMSDVTDWIAMWSPNKIVITPRGTEGEWRGELRLNHNYYRGWRSNTGVVLPKDDQIQWQGVLSPGSSLEIFYQPRGWELALLIQFISLVISVVVIFRKTA